MSNITNPNIDENERPRGYKIVISEVQRIALIRVLESVNLEIPDEDLVCPHTGEHPLELWIQMLEELPKVEQKTPEILHDFTA